MSRPDMGLRRFALQLCGQLPDDYADGIEVLKHMREIWGHLYLGGEHTSNVLSLVPQPPPGLLRGDRDDR
jgi:hypothetical protein